MQRRAVDGKGRPVNPGDGVVPIMKETERGRLSVVGTGFYITRYGLFLTARHVMQSLVDRNRNQLGTAYVCHLAGNDKVHLRRIIAASLLEPPDLAVGQADNYVNKYPDNPLQNMRAPLTTMIPPIGSNLITYAYPENEVLDFTQEEPTLVINGDYYEGELIGHIVDSDNPSLPYPHLETTIELRNGASGGPVFGPNGRVIGVNCRGWNFAGEEFEGQHLSYIVPVGALLDLQIELLQLPEFSWEQAQIPAGREATTFTIAELARLGHVNLQPKVRTS